MRAGWIASSGRVAVVGLSGDDALVCYDRQGWGGGADTSPLLFLLSSFHIYLLVVPSLLWQFFGFHDGSLSAGYYGVGLAPVFGPLGEWPFGRSAPPGCFLDISTVFCMRVEVQI